HGVAGPGGIAVGFDHPHAEDGHARGLAAGRPGVGEVDDLPDDQQDRSDDEVVLPFDGMAGQYVEPVRGGGPDQGEEPEADKDVDDECRQTADRPGIRALQADGSVRGDARGHWTTGVGAGPGRAGRSRLRNTSRPTQRSRNWSSPTAWLRATSSASV